MPLLISFKDFKRIRKKDQALIPHISYIFFRHFLMHFTLIFVQIYASVRKNQITLLVYEPLGES